MSTPFESEVFNRLVDTRTALHPIVRVVGSRGGVEFEPEMVGGSISLDRTRMERITADLQIRVNRKLPSLETVNPFGTVVDIQAGLRKADGTEELVDMGIGTVVTSVSGEYHDGGVMNLSCSDRSRRVTRWRFERPFTAKASDLSNMIGQVLTDRRFYPDGRSVQLPNVGTVLSKNRVFGLEAGLGPWEECIKLAESFGHRLWVNRRGDPVLDEQPDVSGTPVRDVLLMAPGTPSMTDEPPNVIVARFEPNDGTPRIGIAEDTDPSSPTRVTGPYERVTGYHGPVNLEVSRAAAQQAATKILAQRKWQGVTWSWTIPWNPTVDPDDRLRARPRGQQVTVAVDTVEFDMFGNTVINGRQPVVST